MLSGSDATTQEYTFGQSSDPLNQPGPESFTVQTSGKFIDPSSLSFFKIPVLSADAHHYDLQGLASFYKTRQTSLLTNKPLQSNVVIFDSELYNEVKEHIELIYKTNQEMLEDKNHNAALTEINEFRERYTIESDYVIETLKLATAVNLAVYGLDVLPKPQKPKTQIRNTPASEETKAEIVISIGEDAPNNLLNIHIAQLPEDNHDNLIRNNNFNVVAQVPEEKPLFHPLRRYTFNYEDIRMTLEERLREKYHDPIEKALLLVFPSELVCMGLYAGSHTFRNTIWFDSIKYLLTSSMLMLDCFEGTENEIYFQRLSSLIHAFIHIAISNALQKAALKSNGDIGSLVLLESAPAIAFIISMFTLLISELTGTLANNYNYSFERLFYEDEGQRQFHSFTWRDFRNLFPLDPNRYNTYLSKQNLFPVWFALGMQLPMSLIDIICREYYPETDYFYAKYTFLLLPLLTFLFELPELSRKQKCVSLLLCVLANVLTDFVILGRKNEPNSLYEDDTAYYSNMFIIIPGLMSLAYLLYQILEKPVAKVYEKAQVCLSNNRYRLWTDNVLQQLEDQPEDVPQNSPQPS